MAKLLRFYSDRRPRWRRLEELLALADADAPLTGDQADELYRLYRLASCDLAFMQTHTGNPALLDHLETLVARAHLRLTPSESTDILDSLSRTLRHRFPEVVRSHLRLLLLTIALFAGGGLFGAVLSLVEPEATETFLAPFSYLLEQSPAEDAAARSGPGRSPDAASSIAFSVQLFTNNLRVALLCFALGLTFGVGTAVVLFSNGVILGSVAAIYARDGVFLFFLAWVGPHGSLELPAIVLAGMTGFMMARAQLSGGGGVWRKIAAHKDDYTAMLAGIAVLLLVAGGIEGCFSQFHSPSITYLKIAVAAACFAGLLAWVFILPVENNE